MKKLLSIIVLLVCFLVTLTSAIGSDVKDPAYAPGELLVKYKAHIRAAAAEFYLNLYDIKTIKVFKSGTHHVKLPEDMTVEEALEIYQDDPDVVYAEPNYYYHIDTTPNDPYFDRLWGLHNRGQTEGTVDADIDAPEAWAITTGSSNVIIAVIDTGVDYTHPDLSPNIWTNSGETPNDGIDNDGNGYVDDIYGWDFAYNTNNPMDADGHGTHCAGTIAAKGNNSAGITGVCWTAKIMVLKGLNNDGDGWTSTLLPAIEYANANGAHVINNSWGGGGPSIAIRDAICASSAAVVCAAGNDGTDNDYIAHYPSSYDCSNIIAVAATEHNDHLWLQSNYGVTSVDVAAPGSCIQSTAPGGGYQYLSGTSMAAPHVSGVAALIKAKSPTFTNANIKTAIMNKVDTKAGLSGMLVSGGRVNAFKSLPTPAPPPPGGGGGGGGSGGCFIGSIQ